MLNDHQEGLQWQKASDLDEMHSSVPVTVHVHMYMDTEMQSDFNCVGNKTVYVTFIWTFRGYFYKKDKARWFK